MRVLRMTTQLHDHARRDAPRPEPGLAVTRLRRRRQYRPFHHRLPPGPEHHPPTAGTGTFAPGPTVRLPGVVRGGGDAAPVRPGDMVRVRVHGDRRPPLVGTVVGVQACKSVSGNSVVVVRGIDDGHVACIPSSTRIELLERPARIGLIPSDQPVRELVSV